MTLPQGLATIYVRAVNARISAQFHSLSHHLSPPPQRRAQRIGGAERRCADMEESTSAILKSIGTLLAFLLFLWKLKDLETDAVSSCHVSNFDLV